MSQRLKPIEGWSTFFLALSLVLLSSFTILQSDIIEGLEVLLVISVAGYVAGYLLAKSIFSSRTAVGFSFVYGLFTIALLIGLTFYPADMPWRERLIDMPQRQLEWLDKAFSGGTSRDGLIFIMHTSIIYWVLSYTAAWYTFRQKHIWRVVLPSGILLLSVVYYYYGTKPLWALMGLYTITALLYIARTYLSEQESEWRQAFIRYKRSTSINFLIAGFIVALLALTGSGFLPTPTASAALNDAIGGRNPVVKNIEETWTRLFASLRTYGGQVNDPYANTLALGGPRNVGTTLVMDIRVAEQLPYAYWQATSFQTYENGQWLAPTGEQFIHIPDDGLLNTPLTAGREVITQTVRNYIPNTAALFGLPEIVGSNKQIVVTQQQDAQDKSLVSLVQSRYILQQGDEYVTYSRLSVIDEASLRRAGQGYPSWIDPYLQVPATLTPETRDLAAKLTEPYDNEYDQAIAVRDYLRRTITYNDQIAAPPDNIDPIHYVLFEQQEGYCNYYASAMAMMLRSQGIPARVVAGYAAGEFVAEANVYRVRANDAHTWVEVYFPRYGWITFEPTASIDVVNRPAGEGEEGNAVADTLPPFSSDAERSDFLPDEDLFLDPADFERNNPSSPTNEGEGTGLWVNLDPIRVMQATGAGLTVILAGLVLFSANRINVRIEGDVVESYGRLDKWGTWLGVAADPTQTPFERADTLSTAVPEATQPIRNLTSHYVLKTYSSRPEDADQFTPADEWRLLRPIMLRQIARHKVETARQRLRRFIRRLTY